MQRPSQGFNAVTSAIAGHHGRQEGLIHTKNQLFTSREQQQFLFNLLFQGNKMLLVCIPDMGEDPDCRPDYRSEFLHFAGFADPRFENRQVVVSAHKPYRQRYAGLGIVTLRTSHNGKFAGKEVMKPLFDDRLAVAPGNPDHGYCELHTVEGRKPLQGHQRVLHRDEG